MEVIATVHSRGGRFLKKIDSEEKCRKLGIPQGQQAWLVADDDVVVEKTKQGFRDANPQHLETSKPTIMAQLHSMMAEHQTNSSSSPAPSRPVPLAVPAAIETSLSIQTQNTDMNLAAMYQILNASARVAGSGTQASSSSAAAATAIAPQHQEGPQDLQPIAQALLQQYFVDACNALTQRQARSSVPMTNAVIQALLREIPRSYLEIVSIQQQRNLRMAPCSSNDLFLLNEALSLARSQGDETRVSCVQSVFQWIEQQQPANHTLTPLELTLLRAILENIRHGQQERQRHDREERERQEQRAQQRQEQQQQVLVQYAAAQILSNNPSLIRNMMTATNATANTAPNSAKNYSTSTGSGSSSTSNNANEKKPSVTDGTSASSDNAAAPDFSSPGHQKRKR
jgi:hypothetical protein